MVKSKGQGQVEWDQYNETLEQAEKRVIRLASTDAIENAFGILIVQGNATYIKNVNDGDKTDTKTVFNMVSNSSVKGEIVEVISTTITRIPYKAIVNGISRERTDLKCEIYAKVREITDTPVAFEVSTLTEPDKKFNTAAFKDGSNFYVYFKSPESGYLCIYLDDKKSAFRILPYSKPEISEENGMQVLADKEYVLFSTKAEPAKKHLIDSYQLFADSEQDMYRMFVIFSKSPIHKPSLNDVSISGLDPKIIVEGYTLPRSVHSPEFQEWLVNTVLSTTTMHVKYIDITVTR